MTTLKERMNHAKIHFKCLILTLLKGKNPMFYIKGLLRTFFTIKY